MQSGKIVSNIEIMGGADWMNPGTTAQINYMGGSMEKVFSAAEKTPTKDIYATLEGVEFELKLLKTVG
ncbi:hypothetical protein, partial [Thermococcus peptonophilus]|uniref:hypothetical protein n=1 Tax=Thermococcus peptonophilus TaxID=53952 RepID=UPI000B2E64D5